MIRSAGPHGRPKNKAGNTSFLKPVLPAEIRVTSDLNCLELDEATVFGAAILTFAIASFSLGDSGSCRPASGVQTCDRK